MVGEEGLLGLHEHIHDGVADANDIEGFGCHAGIQGKGPGPGRVV
jgi:hypothetical protein